MGCTFCDSVFDVVETDVNGIILCASCKSDLDRGRTLTKTVSLIDAPKWLNDLRQPELSEYENKNAAQIVREIAQGLPREQL